MYSSIRVRSEALSERHVGLVVNSSTVNNSGSTTRSAPAACPTGRARGADSGDPNSHVLTGFQPSLPDRSEARPVNVIGDGQVKFAAKYLRVSSLVPTPDELRQTPA